MADLLTDYEYVAAGQNNQVMGPSTGKIGNILELLIVVPATLSPGAVTIKDGSDTAITVFTGGADSITSLRPITILVNARSRVGAWQVTTGSNVSVLAVGSFT